ESGKGETLKFVCESLALKTALRASPIRSAAPISPGNVASKPATPATALKSQRSMETAAKTAASLGGGTTPELVAAPLTSAASIREPVASAAVARPRLGSLAVGVDVAAARETREQLKPDALLKPAFGGSASLGDILGTIPGNERLSEEETRRFAS